MTSVVNPVSTPRSADCYIRIFRFSLDRFLASSAPTFPGSGSQSILSKSKWTMEGPGDINDIPALRGPYKSTPLVRSLRLQRLKDTTMSIEAALDKRQAIPLAKTILPKPKVRGRKKGNFSDITRLLSSSPAPARTTQKLTIDKNSKNKASTRKQGDQNDEVGSQITISEPTRDEVTASLLMVANRAGTKKSRRAGKPELAEFEKSLSQKQRQEMSTRVQAKIKVVTKKVRQKCDEEQSRLDKLGLFHPAANSVRIASRFQVMLKRKLDLGRIENSVLADMLAESRGEVRHRRRDSALDDKFANMLNNDQTAEDQKFSSSHVSEKPSAAESPARSISGASRSLAKESAHSMGDSTHLNSLASDSGSAKRTSQSVQSLHESGEKVPLSSKPTQANKATFQPAEEILEDVGRKIGEETQAKLKEQVRGKFASGENIDYDNVVEDDEEHLQSDEEDDEIWNDNDEESLEGLHGPGLSVLSTSSGRNLRGTGSSSLTVPGNSVSTMQVTKSVKSRLHSSASKQDDEYEVHVDEWGREVLVKKAPRIRPMAKTKKDNRVDTFQEFRKKKIAEARRKKLRRQRLLNEGKFDETTTANDFEAQQEFSGSTKRRALGPGRHSHARREVKQQVAVGEKAVNRPLPGYIRHHVREVARSAGIDESELLGESAQASSEVEQKVSRTDGGVASSSYHEKMSTDHDSEDELETKSSGTTQSLADVALEDKSLPHARAPTRMNRQAPARGDKNKQRKKGEKNPLRIRLENLWEDLEMPYLQKIEFASKYSHPRRAESMNDSLPIWERAAQLILSRERMLLACAQIRDLQARREKVEVKNMFSQVELATYVSLGIYIDTRERPMLPLTWVLEMFKLASRFLEDKLTVLEEDYEDQVTFRGHLYRKVMKDQAAIIEKQGIEALEPLSYVGNPFLRRTGKLLVKY